MAFFPAELEKDLLAKELKHARVAESKIVETRFVVKRSPTGRGYEPVVEDQQLRP